MARYFVVENPTLCPFRGTGNFGMGSTCGFKKDMPTFPCFEADFIERCPLEKKMFATKDDFDALSKLIKPLIVPRDERPF